VNVDAYQLYLKAQYHRLRNTPDSLANAKECLEQALAIDRRSRRWSVKLAIRWSNI
jgi:hypothetical protein